MSLNPPPDERVSIDVFEAAINSVEERLGLEEQPRAIVFHEKDGRRHAHAVWSRIDSEEMKAINLPFYKMRLREVSKELYLENSWQMPRGLVDSRERDPASFTRAEWQQARRAGHDPKALKAMFQECWAISDSRKAFAQALQSRGYHLARGDRRGHVAVDYRGEVYAVSRYVCIRTKEVKARLGEASEFPSVDETRTAVSARMSNMLRHHVREAEASYRAQSASLAFRRNEAVQRQREERAQIERAQQERWAREALERTERLSKGFRGLWDRLTGKHTQIRRQNERETLLAMQRDRAEKDALIFRHLEERQVLHNEIRQRREAHAKELQRLHQDIAGYMSMAAGKPPAVRAHFREAHGHEERLRALRSGRVRGPDRDRDFEPEI